MFVVHLRDLLVTELIYKHQDAAAAKKSLIEKLKKQGCTVSEQKWVTGWPEEVVPPWAPYDHLQLISRLDEQQFDRDGLSYTASSYVKGSGRIYTTLASEGKEVSYQTQPGAIRRAYTWKGQPLASFDVSASQLRVALALRGRLLDFDLSPWDDVAKHPDHAALKGLTDKQRRAMIKKFALFFVRGNNSYDVSGSWEDVASEEGITVPRPSLVGLKKHLEYVLLDVFPELRRPIPELFRTPDGYVFQKEIGQRQVKVKCRPLKIETTFILPVYGKPEAHNVIEGLEAYVLRRVIRALPLEAPILTCHDEMVTLPQLISIVKSEWENGLFDLTKREGLISSPLSLSEESRHKQKLRCSS